MRSPTTARRSGGGPSLLLARVHASASMKPQSALAAEAGRTLWRSSAKTARSDA
jgi:hypothetical protein